MSEQSDAPTTTGRRTCQLIRTLALPWIVCGGLLWALVGLTPDPVVLLTGRRNMRIERPDPGEWPAMASISVGRSVELPRHPVLILANWNAVAMDGFYSIVPGTVRSGEASFVETPDAAGVYIMTGRRKGSWFAAASFSVWYLIPFPLLWSGFNLWRWTRRAN